MCPVDFKNYNSVGFPLPNVQLRIVDENAKNLGPNK
ncbi:putative AMP dependent coa ligase, partial [Danaus plexippus plexippus]